MLADKVTIGGWPDAGGTMVTFGGVVHATGDIALMARTLGANSKVVIGSLSNVQGDPTLNRGRLAGACFQGVAVVRRLDRYLRHGGSPTGRFGCRTPAPQARCSSMGWWTPPISSTSPALARSTPLWVWKHAVAACARTPMAI
jgi:hypothetical protein